jgi:FolB domain-containing protein
MDQIMIRDLRIYGIIGVYEWERNQPQEILINIVLSTDLRKAGRSDNLADTIDYAKIAQKVRDHAEKAGRFTVEALATDLAALCLEEPAVQKVVVRLEKPAAVPDCRSVGVEIERSRGGLGVD